VSEPAFKADSRSPSRSQIVKGAVIKKHWSQIETPVLPFEAMLGEVGARGGESGQGKGAGEREERRSKI